MECVDNLKTFFRIDGQNRLINKKSMLTVGAVEIIVCTPVTRIWDAELKDVIRRSGFLSPKWENAFEGGALRLLGGNTCCSLKIELCDKWEPLQAQAVSSLSLESFKLQFVRLILGQELN